MPIKPAVFGHKVSAAETSRAYNNGRRRNTPALAHAQRLRNTANYRNFRRMFLAEHPLCYDPYRNCGVRAAEQVHHIVGLAARPDWAFLESNCAALCEHCHAQIEADERQGKKTQQLFAARRGQAGLGMAWHGKARQGKARDTSFGI